ncbi:MAG: GspE/PulE/PilB domain-containing protein [Planctomycetota bacterium]
MAFFKRKREPEAEGPVDHRSKRGGARRQTGEIQVDLSELDKRAAPAPGMAPQPKVGPAPPGAKPTTRRMPAGAAARGRSSRRSGRSSGRGTPIGELLIKAGAVNTEQVTRALRLQQQRGGLIGQILVEMEACSTEDIAEALAKQFRFTQVDLSAVVPTPESLMLVPADRCRELKLIPFECVGPYICAAMVNVLNRRALTQMESLSKLKAKGFTSTWPDIKAAIDKYYTPEVDKCVQAVNEARTSGGGLPLEVARKLAAELTTAGKAPAGESGRRRKVSRELKTKVRTTKPPAEVEYITAAERLRAQGRLDDAVRRLEAGLAALPQAQKIQEALGKLRSEIEAKRAEEAEQHRRLAEMLAQGRAEREAGRLKEALAKFQEASKLDPQNNVIQREISVTQKLILKPKRRKTALDRAASKKSGAAAFGGETRLQAGQVDESTLVTLREVPQALHVRLGEIVAAREGAPSAEDGLARLAVGRIYAKSLEDLRKMAEAAKAAEAALGEEILVPDESEQGLELEPAIDPQAPMPELEAQLEAEPEILDAVAIEDGEDIEEAEVLEAEPDRLAAESISEAEFASLAKALEPDPVQKWHEIFADAGPIPAAPAGN